MQNPKLAAQLFAIETLTNGIGDFGEMSERDIHEAVNRINGIAAVLIERVDELLQSNLERNIAPALAFHGYPELAGLLVSGPGPSDEVH